MKKFFRSICWIWLPLALLTGCAVERGARLYPANDAAIPGGVLTARFIANGTGNGELELITQDGEIFKGEYSIVRGGVIGFGSVYSSVYGPRSTASGFASSANQHVERGSQGSASAFSNKARTLMCEFFNDNASGHGQGACRTNTGELYRLQY